MSSTALLAALAQSALADDLTVLNGTVLTTPQSTATAFNGTAGNITFQTGSTLRVSTPGAAVTLNSNNSISHLGLIEALAPSGGIGVHLVGGFAGNFSAQGSAGAIINVTGSGTGNYALLLDGTAPFTGNITFDNTSAIIVYGEDSTGIAINTALNGDLVTAANLQGTGLGTTGIKVTKEITGLFTNSGTIAVRGTNLFTAENVDPLSGSGIAIGASLGKGFLNAGPVSGSDGSTTTGRVTNSSTAPAVLIAPSVAGATAGNIVLGPRTSDSARLDFSFINRGTVTASQNDVGISTTGVRIGETGPTNLTVLLSNGFYNRGSITSSSQSDNLVSTTATAVPTDATGIVIGNGATVNAFTAPGQSVVTTGWGTKAASGSTATTILLGADGSDVDGIYEGFVVSIGGVTRVVTDYAVVRNEDNAVVSKTLTLNEALATVPATDAPVTILPPANTSVALGPAASEITGAYNGFSITTGGETRIVSEYVVIYDPVTSLPTLRVAKIEGASGTFAPWASPPTEGAPATLATSALFNSGSITASMNGSEGGVVTTILIQQGGTLPSITNYGSIDASARTTDNAIDALTAVAINDQSGKLNEIINHGRIAANVTELLNGSQVSIAADLSRSASAQKFYVLSGGDVIGDVLFGSAPVDGVTQLAQNRLIIEGSVTRTQNNTTFIDNSSVFGSVRPAGDTGSLAIEISRLGTGGALRTSNTRATSIEVGPRGSIEFALAKGTGTAALISTTGSVKFGANTTITITPTSFLPANGTYTLISTGTPNALSFANFAQTARLNSGSPFPFLLEGTFTADGAPLNVTSGNITASSLGISLRRKTATELGLQGNLAAIYEPLAAAALNDNEFGAALLRLSSADQVEATIATAVPDIAGGVRALTVAMTDQATGVIGTRQRALLTAPEGTRDEFRFWGQEFYNTVSANGTGEHLGFGGAGQGVAVGVEWDAFASGRVGAGFTFFSSQEVERNPRETKTNGDWNMLSAYGAWRVNDFFIAPQINVGVGDFKSRRVILVGDTVGRLATAKWSGYLAAGGATAGYVIDVGENIDIIPTLAIDLMYLSQSAYNEGGAGGMGLSLRSQSQTSVRSFAGVIGQGTYTFNEGAFMPQVLAGWSHEFANDPATIDGSFESSPGSPFHLVGPTLDANRIVGGMSLGYVMRNWAAGFNYDASASTGSLAQSATFSISSRF